VKLDAYASLWIVVVVSDRAIPASQDNDPRPQSDLEALALVQ
jgi:hypothetical protein